MPYYARGGGGMRGRGGGRMSSHDDEPKDPEHEQFRKLFIGGLSYDTDEAGLRTHFEQWGEITDCIVMRDSQSKKSRGFGFITFQQSAALDDTQENRPHTLDGREVETKRAMRKDLQDAGLHQSVTKMFVGGMKDDTTESHVREVFEPLGTIKAVTMVKDKVTQKTRGFCFVEFTDYDTVDKCVLTKRFNVNGRSVEVKKAVSKEQIENSKQSRGGYGGEYGGGGYGGYGGGYDSYCGGYGGQNWGYGGGYGDHRGYGGGNGYGNGHGNGYGNGHGNGYGNSNGYGGGQGYGGSQSYSRSNSYGGGNGYSGGNNYRR